MGTNPILDEIYAAREKLLAEAGGELDRLVEQTRARQAKSGHKVIAGRVGKAEGLATRVPLPDTSTTSGESSPATTQ